MSIEWFIYLLGMVDGIKEFLIIFLIFSFVIIASLILTVDMDFERPTPFSVIFKKYSKFVYSIIVLAIITILIPNSKTLTLIASVSYGKEVLQTEEFGKVKKILDLKLEEALKELEGSK